MKICEMEGAVILAMMRCSITAMMRIWLLNNTEMDYVYV